MSTSSPFPIGLFPQQEQARTITPNPEPQKLDGSLQGSQPSSLQGIVQIANEQGFSDVHLGVGEEPRYRDRGDMVSTGWPVTEAAGFQAWLREMLSPAQVDAFQRDQEFDGSHAFPFVRVRINLLESLRGPAMVLRLIPQTISTLKELKLPEVLQELSS